MGAQLNISDVEGNFYETNPIANRIYFVTQNGLFNCEDKNADIQLCRRFSHKKMYQLLKLLSMAHYPSNQKG